MNMSYTSQLRFQNLKSLKQNSALKILIFVLLFILMNIQYSINLDRRNLIYKDFDRVSQNLAESAVFAGANGIAMPSYGLGHTEKVIYPRDEKLIDKSLISNIKVVPVLENYYTSEYMVEGLRFENQNGEIFTLEGVKSKDNLLYLYFDRDVGSLRGQEQLNYCKMIDTNGDNIPFASVRAYTKQYGLQGKIYYHMARLTSVEFAENAIKVCCTLLLSSVIMGICLLIHKRYKDIKLTAAFYLGFLLSPWIAAFSSNFYWVAFTWFIPMLIGLLYVCYPKQKLIWFVAAFIAVLIKSLCGFEYLSTILMGLVIFPIAEFFVTSEKKRKKAIFCDTFIFTCVSVVGFLGAVGVLANILGDGNIIEGVNTIYTRDVLSKTLLAGTGAVQQNSESLLQVILQYFAFPTDVITGVIGDLFLPIITVGTLGMAGIVYKKEKNCKAYAVLFVFSFLTSLSWLILGKAHSVIHPHLNFVLWYFGFIQMNLYVWIYLINSFYINIIKMKNGRYTQLEIKKVIE